MRARAVPLAPREITKFAQRRGRGDSGARECINVYIPVGFYSFSLPRVLSLYVLSGDRKVKVNEPRRESGRARQSRPSAKTLVSSAEEERERERDAEDAGKDGEARRKNGKTGRGFSAREGTSRRNKTERISGPAAATRRKNADNYFQLTNSLRSQRSTCIH